MSDQKPDPFGKDFQKIGIDVAKEMEKKASFSSDNTPPPPEEEMVTEVQVLHNQIPKNSFKKEIDNSDVVGDESRARNGLSPEVPHNLPVQGSDTSNLYSTEDAQFSGNTPADKVEINPLRTYKEDINRMVNRKHITSSKILIAEQKSRQEKPLKTSSVAPIKPKIDKNSIQRLSNKFILVLSFLLIAAAIIIGIWAGINWISGIGSTPIQEVTIRNDKFFVVDHLETVDITNRLRNDIEINLYDLLQSEYPDRSITEIILFREEEDARERIPTSSLNNLLELRTPSIFNRSLSNNYLFGVFTLGGDNHPFIIYELLDFENAFDSVFDWEDTLVEDLRDVFGGFAGFEELRILREERQIRVGERIDILNATSTATTTVSATTTENALVEEEIDLELDLDEEIRRGLDLTNKSIDEINGQIEETEDRLNIYRNFIDLIIQNTDTRTVIGENGEVLIYYAFINQDKWLLIADDVEVLREVKRRVRERSLVR